jgi:dipeptidyl aminopeptidase/acylaminoacyl peptidase
VSILIWNVNYNTFGNPFLPCFFLSLATFLIIFTPFEIYFTFRDFWYERWVPIDIDDVQISKIKVEVGKTKKKKKEIAALLIESKNLKKAQEINSLIIIAHGFSDTKESLQSFYLPFVRLGYVIFIYDARGTGISKNVGRKGDFLARINDFKILVNWINKNPILQQKRIFSIGFSIGALTILCGGFSDERIEKIIAISAMSNYRKNLPRYNIIALLSYLIKGVKLLPKKNENEKISPLFQIKKAKEVSNDEKWQQLSKRVLLVHCKNDRIIKLKNFIENRDALDLPYKNQLILNRGGHNLKKNELILQGASIKFLMN